jgi:Kdo2-lipid IVA lauroyltransferase/acyltransferase
MARTSTPAVIWTQYLSARLAEMTLNVFPVEANLRTAAAVARGLYRIDRRHRQRIHRHLRLAMPDCPDAEIEELAVQSFEHLLQLVVEIIHTPRLIHADSWAKRLRNVSLGPALEVLNAGRPALLITGHLGNWEILGYLMGVLGYPLDAIARPIDNPLINRWLLGIRERRGMRIITKWNATDRMLEVIASGGTLGFIADQNAGPKGVFVPFFGKLASTYKSIGLLAISQNVPLLCGYARRIGDGFNYELGCTDVIEPHHWADKPDPLFYITARYMHAIETMVRQCPQQYLWMHRRWKTRPKWELQGKPLPAALRRNLESLPWMDDATMQRLSEPLEA